MTSDTDQIQTASIGDPVDAYERTGRPLPSYISDAPPATEVAATPKPTVKVLPPSGTPAAPVTVNVPVAPAVSAEDTAVATVDPIAPIPYPANLRPKTPTVVAPIVTAPVVDEDVASLPAADTPVRRPPSNVEQRYVSEEELADWDSGSLSDYLESRGLIADAAYDDGSSAEYDSDGFFLDEGPNKSRSIRSRSRRDNDGFFFVFPN